MSRSIRFNPDDLIGNMGGIPIEKDTEKEEKTVPAKKEAPMAVKPQAKKVEEKRIEEKPKEDKPVETAPEPKDMNEITAKIRDEHGSYRGNRQGKKLRYLHISVSDEMYEYIVTESAKRGLSRVVFINYIFQSYMDSPEGHIKFS